MKHKDGTRVYFKPEERRGDPPEQHRGTVIYHTTDDFYRVDWDKPNPNPSFFNLERVFRYEQLGPLQNSYTFTAKVNIGAVASIPEEKIREILQQRLLDGMMPDFVLSEKREEPAD